MVKPVRQLLAAAALALLGGCDEFSRMSVAGSFPKRIPVSCLRDSMRIWAKADSVETIASMDSTSGRDEALLRIIPLNPRWVLNVYNYAQGDSARLLLTDTWPGVPPSPDSVERTVVTFSASLSRYGRACVGVDPVLVVTRPER